MILLDCITFAYNIYIFFFSVNFLGDACPGSKFLKHFFKLEITFCIDNDYLKCIKNEQMEQISRKLIRSLCLDCLHLMNTRS